MQRQHTARSNFPGTAGSSISAATAPPTLPRQVSRLHATLRPHLLRRVIKDVEKVCVRMLVVLCV
jgi:hypothetical protein